MEKTNRYRHVGLWTAVASQVMTILQLTEVLTISQVELTNNLITAAFQILVLVGILINPTTPGLKD